MFSFINSFNQICACGKPLVKDLIAECIVEAKKRKHKDGTTKDTFQAYEKLERRLQAFCVYKKIKWESLLVEDLTTEFINAVFDWIDNKNKGKGMIYVSVTLHALIGYAEKKDLHSFDKLKGVRWAKKSSVSAHKYRTLTTVNGIVNLAINALPNGRIDMSRIMEQMRQIAENLQLNISDFTKMASYVYTQMARVGAVSGKYYTNFYGRQYL